MSRLVQLHTCMSRLVQLHTYMYVKTRSVTYIHVCQDSFSYVHVCQDSFSYIHVCQRLVKTVTYMYVKIRSVSCKLAHRASIAVYPEAFARFVAVPSPSPISQPRPAPGCAALHHPTPLLVLAVAAGPFTDYRSAERLGGWEEGTAGSLGA